MDASVTIRFPSFPTLKTTPENSTSLEDAGHLEKSDEALLVQTGTGNPESLATLFRRYAHIVRGIAYRVLRNAAEADDLLQDVFILIQRLSMNFDASKGSARTWILQMTYRRALSRRRYLMKRHFYSHQELDAFSTKFSRTDTAGQHENPIQIMLGKKDLREIFQELSENERQALLLRFVEGYELSEIAEKMGQSRANIKNHYFRGIEKLRKHLFDGKLTGKRAL